MLFRKISSNIFSNGKTRNIILASNENVAVWQFHCDYSQTGIGLARFPFFGDAKYGYRNGPCPGCRRYLVEENVFAILVVDRARFLEHVPNQLVEGTCSHIFSK